MADPYEYFCKPDTPKDLKDALLGGNKDKLRAWCKENPDRLALALECIHSYHEVYRGIVQHALSEHHRSQDGTTAERQHQEDLAAARRANVLSCWALAIAILALVITAFQLASEFVDRRGHSSAAPRPAIRESSESKTTNVSSPSTKPVATAATPTPSANR